MEAPSSKKRGVQTVARTVTKTQEVDMDFKRLINIDRVYTCEKHFIPDDIEICK